MARRARPVPVKPGDVPALITFVVVLVAWLVVLFVIL
jgi:hypothetical protein